MLSQPDEALLDAILSEMCLKEKLGQMLQPDWRAFRASPRVEVACSNTLPATLASLVRKLLNQPLSEAACERGLGAHGLGSVLGGGGASPTPNVPEVWAKQMCAMQRAAAKTGSGVPLLICNDTVHGQTNLSDATFFPHHIGQGCMQDAALVEELAVVAAKESHACGINW